VKRLGGHPPVRWHADGAVIGEIGRFWTGEFGREYDALHRQLAERYDGDDRIREVVIARCTTEFAEPYTRQTNQLALNAAELRTAG
jgi:hypothetical protein